MNKTNPVMNNTADKFMGKKVNPESHMVRRNENGRLPSIAIWLIACVYDFYLHGIHFNLSKE